MPPKHHRSPSPSPPDPSNPSNPTDHPNPNQTTGTTAAPPKRHKSSTTSSRAAGIDRDEPGWFRLDYITQIQNGGGASAMPPTFRTPGWSFGARGDGGVPAEAATDDAVADGAADDEAAEDQAANDEAAEDQAANDEAANDEAANDEAANDEAANDEAANDEAANDETDVEANDTEPEADEAAADQQESEAERSDPSDDSDNWTDRTYQGIVVGPQRLVGELRQKTQHENVRCIRIVSGMWVTRCGKFLDRTAIEQAEDLLSTAHPMFPAAIRPLVGPISYEALKNREGMQKLLREVVRRLLCGRCGGVSDRQFNEVVEAWYEEFEILPRADQGLTLWCEHEVARKPVQEDDVCEICKQSLMHDPDHHSTGAADSSKQQDEAGDRDAEDGADNDGVEDDNSSGEGAERDEGQRRTGRRELGGEAANGPEYDYPAGSDVDDQQQLSEEDVAGLVAATEQVGQEEAEAEQEAEDEQLLGVEEDHGEINGEDNSERQNEDDDRRLNDRPDAEGDGADEDAASEDGEGEKSDESQEDNSVEEEDEDEEEDEEESDEESEEESYEEPEAEPTGPTWCRNGCGRNVHASCWSYWVQQRREGGEPVICLSCGRTWEERKCVECDDQELVVTEQWAYRAGRWRSIERRRYEKILR